MVGGLFLLRVSIVLISLLIGGWEGMGYGFIGISIFLGSMIGVVFTVVIRPMKQG
ncbi:MAG: YesK family protein [Lysinibacillus sp.]